MNTDLGSNYTVGNWIESIKNSPNDIRGTAKRILILIALLTIADFGLSYFRTLGHSRLLVKNIELPEKTDSLNSEYEISITDSPRGDLKVVKTSKVFSAKKQFGQSLSWAIFVGLFVGLITKKQSNQRVDPIVKTPADKVEAQGTQGHP